MKITFTILFLLNMICLLGQNADIIENGDSLIIKDFNITTNPFNLGEDPLMHLTTQLKPAPTIEIKTYRNRHNDEIDSVFNLRFDEDLISVYKWSDDENALIFADLRTKRLKTRHGIQIGMSKSEIINLLNAYNLESLPKMLILENIEILEFLKLHFEEETLSRIEFEGYVD